MKKKSKAVDKFKEFKAKLEKQLGRHINHFVLIKVVSTCLLKSFLSYMSIEIISFLKEHEILSQLSAPGPPQQNGVMDNRNRTLLDMVRSMMSLSTLPLSF